MFMTVTESVT